MRKPSETDKNPSRPARFSWALRTVPIVSPWVATAMLSEMVVGRVAAVRMLLGGFRIGDGGVG